MNRLIGYALIAVLIGLPLDVASAQPAAPGLTIASDSLVGTKVRDNQGKEIGEITKLLIDAKGGKIASAIIKQGGTLGMGGTEVSVPWDVLSIQRGDNHRLVVTLQQPLLEQAPQPQKEGQQGQPPAASPATGGQQERKQ